MEFTVYNFERGTSEKSGSWIVTGYFFQWRQTNSGGIGSSDRDMNLRKSSWDFLRRFRLGAVKVYVTWAHNKFSSI